MNGYETYTDIYDIGLFVPVVCNEIKTNTLKD